MGQEPSRHSRQGPTKKELSYLLKTTSYDRLTIEEWYKVFRKVCGKDSLDSQKFTNLFQRFFPERISVQYCQHVFRAFNSRGNGEMSFTEFITAVYVSSQGSQEEKLRWMFKVYDVNNNGFITIKDLRQVLSQAGKIEKKTNVDEVWENLDRDNRGFVTEDQFLKICLESGDLV